MSSFHRAHRQGRRLGRRDPSGLRMSGYPVLHVGQKPQRCHHPRTDPPRRPRPRSLPHGQAEIPDERWTPRPDPEAATPTIIHRAAITIANASYPHLSNSNSGFHAFIYPPLAERRRGFRGPGFGRVIWLARFSRIGLWPRDLVGAVFADRAGRRVAVAAFGRLPPRQA